MTGQPDERVRAVEAGIREHGIWRAEHFSVDEDDGRVPDGDPRAVGRDMSISPDVPGLAAAVLAAHDRWVLEHRPDAVLWADIRTLIATERGFGRDYIVLPFARVEELLTALANAATYAEQMRRRAEMRARETRSAREFADRARAAADLIQAERDRWRDRAEAAEAPNPLLPRPSSVPCETPILSLGGPMTDQNCVLEHRRDPERPRQALDGLLVCAGHRKGLAFDLLDLPGMHERLVERHTARSPGWSERSGGGHAGLTLQGKVGNIRGDIYSSLASWARDAAETRGFTLPADDLPSIARWLLGRDARMLDWSCAQPFIDEYADDLDRLHRAAFSLLYPRGRRRFEVGDCIEVVACDVETHLEQVCYGRMLATLAEQDDELPSLLWCSDCGMEITADRWITYGRRVHRALEAAS